MELKQLRGRRAFLGAALKTTGALAVASSTPVLLSGCVPPEPDTTSNASGAQGAARRTASHHQADLSASEALAQMQQGHLTTEGYIGALLDRAQSQHALNALITLNDTGRARNGAPHRCRA
ncbi:MAG: hypothetical protein WDN30_12990 [Pararobbsia sp.]